jgi:tetratricopeptide (TPR) repeat protein
MIATMLLQILLAAASPDLWIQEGNANVQKGNEAASYQERKEAFNKALALYSQAEESLPTPNPSLYQAIGDLYFLFGEYPWAVLYYHKALHINPDTPKAVKHLAEAEAKLGTASTHEENFPGIGWRLLRSFTSSSTLFWTILTAFSLCSLAIWFPRRLLRRAAYCSLAFLILLLANSAAFYYFTPLEGILISSSGFYRAPGANQPQLTAVPLLAGSRVVILQSTEGGEWLKIKTSGGIVGYVQTSHLRLISP